jgi:hypothetical protein
MYLRWKRRWRSRRQEWADYAELVECAWVAGRPRQRGLAPAMQQQVAAQLAQQVARPTPDELAALDAQRAAFLQLGQVQAQEGP